MVDFNDLVDGLVYHVNACVRIASSPGYAPAACALGFFVDDKIKDGVKVVGSPCVANIPGELVRVYLHPCGTLLPAFCEPVRAKLLPAFEGGKKPILQETADGFVILRANSGEEVYSHCAGTTQPE